MDEIRNLWNAARENLRELLTANDFDRWLSPIRPSVIKGNKIFLAVDNDFFRDWLANNYKSLIVEALRSAGASDGFEVEFFVQTSPEDPPPSADLIEKKIHEHKRRGPKTQVLNSTLNPMNTFENFVVGPSNSFAHGAAYAVAQSPGKAYNPLFIYGGTGLGKTHLIQAVGHRVQDLPGTKVCYTTTETLLNEYVQSITEKTTIEFRNKYRSVDLLIIDDIHFLAGKNAIQEEFFHTFNALHMSGKQIIITSDRPANEITGLEQRLVSRFEWGLVTQLEMPDFETRLAILRYKQSAAKIRLTDAILSFIAENVKTNIRTLEGALMRAISFVSINKTVELTIDRLRILLKDLLDKEQEKDITVDEIQKTVAEHYGIRLNDMTSKKRPQCVALPRQVAMFLSRKLTRKALSEIAQAFEKTHATILHACTTTQDRMETDPDMRESIRTITRKLKRDPLAFDL